LIRQAVILGILIIMFLVCDGICQVEGGPCSYEGDPICNDNTDSSWEYCDTKIGKCIYNPAPKGTGAVGDTCKESWNCKSELWCNTDGICAVPCQHDDDCDDHYDCTDDFCVDKTCVNDYECPVCEFNIDCNDGNPCTSDTCKENKCYYNDIIPLLEGGESCDILASCECKSGVCNQDGTCAKFCDVDYDCKDNDDCTVDKCGTNGVCSNQAIERLDDNENCKGDCQCKSGTCDDSGYPIHDPICIPVGCPELKHVIEIINMWKLGQAELSTAIDAINAWSDPNCGKGLSSNEMETEKAHLMAMLQPNENLNPVSQCDPGYHLENGQCVQDTPQCDPGYHLENGQCVQDTPQCDPGYHLENGQCVQDTPQCDPGYHLENGQCVPDHMPSDPTCELAYVTNLINKWANDEAELSEVIEAINHWASSECTASSGLSPVAVEQQKAQFMAMLQNPSNQEISNQEQFGQRPSDQEQSGQWPSDNQDPFGQGQNNQGSFPY
jgi:hypothetical protein